MCCKHVRNSYGFGYGFGMLPPYMRFFYNLGNRFFAFLIEADECQVLIGLGAYGVRIAYFLGEGKVF